MKGSFSEESLERFAELAAQTQSADFSEGGTYDFTTCIRPDGSAYGTGGKCRKGTEGMVKKETGAHQTKKDAAATGAKRLRAAMNRKGKPLTGKARAAKMHETAALAHAAAARMGSGAEAAKATGRAFKLSNAAHNLHPTSDTKGAQKKGTEAWTQAQHKAAAAAHRKAAQGLVSKPSEAKKASAPAAPAGPKQKVVKELATRIKRQQEAIARMSPGKYTKKEIEIERQTLQEMRSRLAGMR
jgi:hypothetical protein